MKRTITSFALGELAEIGDEQTDGLPIEHRIVRRFRDDADFSLFHGIDSERCARPADIDLAAHHLRASVAGAAPVWVALNLAPDDFCNARTAVCVEEPLVE